MEARSSGSPGLGQCGLLRQDLADLGGRARADVLREGDPGGDGVGPDVLDTLPAAMPQATLTIEPPPEATREAMASSSRKSNRTVSSRVSHLR